MLRSPVICDRAVVVDDLAVGGPAELDGLWGVDPAGARIAARAKPVLLRRGGGPRANAGVARARDRLADDLVVELHVVRDDARGEVVRARIERVEDLVDLALLVIDDDLEGAEELRRRGGEVRRIGERREGHLHRGRRHRAVLGWDGVALKHGAAKDELGAGDREAIVDVPKELLR